MTWTESHEPMFGNYNLTLLGVDQAWLNITNLANQTLWVYQVSKDCLECSYTRIESLAGSENITAGNSSTIKVSTKFPTNFRLEKNYINDTIPEKESDSTLCTVEANLGEFGVYTLNVSESYCKLNTELEPVNIYLPFLIPILFYISLGVVVILFQKFKDRIPGFGKLNKKPSISGSGQLPTAASPATATVIAVTPPRQRLRSLDTFRGLCIVIMIFVNDGAAGYAFLEHATWDGLYVADLVFPWFLWIMGVCIPVSIKSQVKRNTPVLTILKSITIRSLKLICIGLMLNTIGGPVQLAKWRLPGVLQRFGICYFVAATSVLISSNTDFVNNSKANNKYVAIFQDVVFIWKGWLISLASVLIHTCLTFFLDVPGCPTGYLGPGGLHKGNAHSEKCIGGAAGYIDRQILKEEHVYQWPTAMTTYRSAPYDPEGILGTFTSIFTVWLGVQAGLTLQVYRKHTSRLIRWVIWAIVLGAIGAALCGGRQTGGLIPLNKNLWSLSFVLVLSSFALILLIALYILIDMLKLWSGTPFFEPGMNSILLYIGHTVANDLLPWHFRFEETNSHTKLLIESLWGTSLWVLYAIYLHHKKFFWSL